MKKKMRNLLCSKKGEGYIDIAIAVVVLLSVAVLTINIYSFFTLKTQMDEVANQLIDVATYTGEFGDDFNATANALIAEHPGTRIEYSADKWYDASLRQVQYGDRMTVVVRCTKVLNGGGYFKLNIPCAVSRSGLSRSAIKGEETTAADPGG